MFRIDSKITQWWVRRGSLGENRTTVDNYTRRMPTTRELITRFYSRICLKFTVIESFKG